MIIKFLITTVTVLFSTQFVFAVEGATLTNYKCFGWTKSGKTVKVEFCAAEHLDTKSTSDIESAGIEACGTDEEQVKVKKTYANGRVERRTFDINSEASYWVQTDDSRTLLTTDRSEQLTDETAQTSPYKYLKVNIINPDNGNDGFKLNLKEKGWKFSFKNAYCTTEKL